MIAPRGIGLGELSSAVLSSKSCYQPRLRAAELQLTVRLSIFLTSKTADSMVLQPAWEVGMRNSNRGGVGFRTTKTLESAILPIRRDMQKAKKTVCMVLRLLCVGVFTVDLETPLN